MKYYVTPGWFTYPDTGELPKIWGICNGFHEICYFYDKETAIAVCKDLNRHA